MAYSSYKACLATILWTYEYFASCRVSGEVDLALYRFELLHLYWWSRSPTRPEGQMYHNSIEIEEKLMFTALQWSLRNNIAMGPQKNLVKFLQNMLLSASVERFLVFRMRGFFYGHFPVPMPIQDWSMFTYIIILFFPLNKRQEKGRRKKKMLVLPGEALPAWGKACPSDLFFTQIYILFKIGFFIFLE